MMRRHFALVLGLCSGLLLRAQERFPETDNLKLFERRSELLSAFWGREMKIEAGVVLPPDWQKSEHLPVCYSIHGFGGSHRASVRQAPQLVEEIKAGKAPRLLYVFLDAQFSLGHHEFADSVNNGPWGRALTEEFVPALEQEFGAFAAPAGRFLTGHSSGGWSSLWLQVTWPTFWNGTWSTAPDSVDFRDFTGIDVYGFDNAYKDPNGAPIMLVRRGKEWAMSIEDFVRSELQRRDYGGQFASFDAVFSPRGPDGRPMPMFDRKTGAIDKAVAKAWEKYDISLQLRRNWPKLGPLLQGKLHIYVGTQDTFRLEGALYLLREELKKLGSDAELVFVEGRDHGTLFQPSESWPDGMLARIHKEMRARFDAAQKQ